MQNIITKRLRILVTIMIIVPGLIFISPSDLVSASGKKSSHSKTIKKSSKKSKKSKKVARHYDIQKNRNLALATIENSDELSKLAYGGGDIASNGVVTQEAVYDEGEDLNELALEDDVVIDVDRVKDIYLAYIEGVTEQDNTTAGGVDKKGLFDNITNWLGTPYHFGGTSDRAIDCSAFVLTMFKESSGIHLPRTAREQFTVGKVIKRSDLQFGDLIFFHTRRHAYISHVGIYLGDNLFAHASSRYGVTVSSLESTYYDKRFIGAKRISVGDNDKASR
jgi:hypothetical protein